MSQNLIVTVRASSLFPLPPPPLLPSLCDHSPVHSQQEKHTGVLLSALSHILPADVHTVHSCADKSINVHKRTEILAAYFFAPHLCPHANNPAHLFSLLSDARLLSPQTCNILQPKCFPLPRSSSAPWAIAAVRKQISRTYAAPCWLLFVGCSEELITILINKSWESQPFIYLFIYFSNIALCLWGSVKLSVSSDDVLSKCHW